MHLKNIIRFPYRMQHTCYSCGAAGFQSIVQWYTEQKMTHQRAIALTHAYPDGAGEKAYKKALVREGLTVSPTYTQPALSLSCIRGAIHSDRLIVLGYEPAMYIHGHWVVIIGYVWRMFIVADPLFPVPVILWHTRLLRRDCDMFTVYK